MQLREESAKYQQKHVKGHYTLEYPPAWDDRYRVWVADAEGAIVGFAAFIKGPPGEEYAWALMDMFVTTELQAQSIGTRLFVAGLEGLGIAPEGRWV